MSDVINQALLDETKAVMKDKFNLMVEYFLEDGHTYLSEIAAGVEQNDAAKIKSPVHTIKSSSKQLGAEQLSEIAKEMEQIATAIMDGKSDDFTKIKELHEKIKPSFMQVEEELKQI